MYAEIGKHDIEAENKMILDHFSFSDAPLDLGRVTTTQVAGMKPCGLWLSVPGDQDWPAFTAENFASRLGSVRHAVGIADDANLLVLDSHEAVVGLAKRFPDPARRSSNPSYHDTIDWVTVSRSYDGVIVPDYQHDAWRHIEASWYYAWDCSCACIWNARAIVSSAIHQAQLPQAA